LDGFYCILQQPCIKPSHVNHLVGLGRMRLVVKVHHGNCLVCFLDKPHTKLI
jgi:hypothetical protein